MKVIVEEQIEHPMEQVLDIETGTTVVVHEQTTTIAEMVDNPQYDNKDTEIETQFQEIFDAAMTAYNTQASMVEIIDPKYASRSMEVANAFLNTALAAVKEKSSMKQHKDKLSKVETGPKTINNNLIMDRNELLKMIAAKSGN